MAFFFLAFFLNAQHQYCFCWSDISFGVLEFINTILWQQIESNNEVVAVYSIDAEFARPLWIFGMNSYEFLQSHGQKELIACSYRSPKRVIDFMFLFLSIIVSFTCMCSLSIHF